MLLKFYCHIVSLIFASILPNGFDGNETLRLPFSTMLLMINNNAQLRLSLDRFLSNTNLSKHTFNGMNAGIVVTVMHH